MSKKIKTPPQITTNQEEAHAYIKWLRTKEGVCKPPSCPQCERVFDTFDDAYEILQANLCGYCQGVDKIPLYVRDQLLAAVEAQPSLTKVLKRIMPSRPNVAKLLPNHL